MSDPRSGTAWASSEKDEYDPAPLSADKLSRSRRIVVGLTILVIVFGIVVSLAVVGISRLKPIEPEPPSLQQEASIPLKLPGNGPSVEPVQPAERHESLALGSALSYLASTTANPKTETDIDRLRACLSIEDGYKERLDCYDTIVPPNPKPKPKPKPPVAKLAADCKFLKEEDERLACFNRLQVHPESPKAFQTPKARPSK